MGGTEGIEREEGGREDGREGREREERIRQTGSASQSEELS